MKRKPKAAPRRHAPAAPAILSPAAPPVTVAAVVSREPWYRSIFTDRDGDFDTGRVLVAIVVLAMCYFQWYDTSVNSQPFNAQNFGIGIAGVLGGFAAYLYGDAKRPPAPVPSTTTAIQQTQVTTP